MMTVKRAANPIRCIISSFRDCIVSRVSSVSTGFVGLLGSAWYNTTGNVLIYAQYGMKSDFGGWQNHHTHNILAYVCSCFGEGADDAFTNNFCVVRGGGGCQFWPQYASDAPVRSGPPAPNFLVGNNTVCTASGNVTVGAGASTMRLEDWVAAGHDHGATGSTATLLHQILS